MAIGAKLVQELGNTDYEDFVPCGDFMFMRKLIVGKQIKDVTFRAVEDSDQLCAARDLLNERYGWRGYGSSHNIPTGAHHTTFTAEIDQTVVGTITLAIDSLYGLGVDETFGEEVDQIRHTGSSQVCELTRLAFHSDIRSKEVLAGLFHFVFIYGSMISECTDILIEINPRHTCFYETMLGFERMSALKTNGSVAAPSQLMRLKVDTFRANINKFAAGGGQAVSSRSLYHNFFPPLQETQIRCLLTSHAMLREQPHDRINIKSRYSEKLADNTEVFSSAIDSWGFPLSIEEGADETTDTDVRRAA